MNELVRLVNSLTQDSRCPTHIKILPLGLVKSEKKDFLVDMESFDSIYKRFKERKLDIPIDYEHQTLHDVQAPAAGWIKELILKMDGVYADVEWTDKAKGYLESKEYRYLSPVINVRTSNYKALQLHSVALTNTPAIDGMTPIVNSTQSPLSVDNADFSEDLDDDNFLKKLCEALDLPESSTPTDILRKVFSILNEQGTLKLKTETAAFEAHKQKSDILIQTALKAGKICPPQLDWAVEYALKDPAAFALYVEKTPQIVPMGEFAPDYGMPVSRTHAHDIFGISDEDIRRYGK